MHAGLDDLVIAPYVTVDELERHGAHTVQGVWVRVAQRLAVLAAGVWFNWQLDAPVKRSLVAYDH